jgi:hypothetical protein
MGSPLPLDFAWVFIDVARFLGFGQGLAVPPAYRTYLLTEWSSLCGHTHRSRLKVMSSRCYARMTADTPAQCALRSFTENRLCIVEDLTEMALSTSPKTRLSIQQLRTTSARGVALNTVWTIVLSILRDSRRWKCGKGYARIGSIARDGSQKTSAAFRRPLRAERAETDSASFPRATTPIGAQRGE